jgi:hypothetical protein
MAASAAFHSDDPVVRITHTGLERLSAEGRPELDYLRASGLAQARLQVAVLAGNRHRALEQIDRLVVIDKELERIGEGRIPAPCGDLAAQRLSLASEKLALTSGVELPRLAPAFGAGMAPALAAEEPVEIVEDEALRGRLFHILLWGFGFLILCLGVTAAALAQL